MESPHRSRPWAVAAACGDDHVVEQEVWQGLLPMEDSCWCRLFQKDGIPWYAPMLKQFLKNCSLCEVNVGSVWERLCGIDPMLEQGRE